jgi:hypothetical protein
MTNLDFMRNAAAQPFLGAGRNKASLTPACIVFHDGSNAANSLVNATPGLSHQSSGSWVSVSYTDAQYDSDGMTAPTSSALTITATGLWTFTAHAIWAGNGTGIRGLRFTIDGTTDVVARVLIPGHANGVGCNVSSRPVRINAGSTITLQAYQDSTGNLSLSAASFDSPWWGAVLVGSV